MVNTRCKTHTLRMSKALLFAASLLSASVAGASTWELFDHAPAPVWTEGYPVGNGNLGAINHGGYPAETIVLNDDTVWSPRPRRALAPNSRKRDMDQAFDLALKHDYAGAQAAYCRAKDKGNSVASFQTLASLQIIHGDPTKPQSTRRALDLRVGESSVVHTFADGVVTQTILASYPDKCVAIRLENMRPAGLDCRLRLGRPGGVSARHNAKNEFGFEGSTGPGGTRFATRLRAITETGTTVTIDGDELLVHGGQSIVLLVTAATNYNRNDPRHPRTDTWISDADNRMDKAAATGWETIRNRSATDHRALMDRCTVELGTTPAAIAVLSTPERMALIRKGGQDPDLVETFFQFGRHLLVSSSRPGSLPPNLQGLWEATLVPAWNGDFHLNVDFHMNFWHANTTGLDECNEPYFALIKNLHHYGAETARSLGCRGYAAGLASDAWGLSDWIGGNPEWDSYILGGNWTQQYLMESYRFNGDRAWLRQTAWPILRDGAAFILDFLREDPATGKLITGPGGSPENAFYATGADGKKRGYHIAVGNTHDLAIARETLTDLLEAAKILGVTDDITAAAEKALPRLQPPVIGVDGRILEWREPFEEVWPGHRHKSHLYGLHPGNQITRATPELFAAAKKSLEVRLDPKYGDNGQLGDAPGGGHVGWSISWNIALLARLGQGDQALKWIYKQLQLQVNDNLFNRCLTKFLMDGNCGTAGAISEMLIQSHETTADGSPLIRLIPALPSAWADGHAHGLRARGGITVDLQWRAGRITRADFYAASKKAVTVVIDGRTETRETKQRD